MDDKQKKTLERRKKRFQQKALANKQAAVARQKKLAKKKEIQAKIDADPMPVFKAGKIVKLSPFHKTNLNAQEEMKNKQIPQTEK